MELWVNIVRELWVSMVREFWVSRYGLNDYFDYGDTFYELDSVEAMLNRFDNIC